MQVSSGHLLPPVQTLVATSLFGHRQKMQIESGHRGRITGYRDRTPGTKIPSLIRYNGISKGRSNIMLNGFVFFKEGKLPFVIEDYHMELFTDAFGHGVLKQQKFLPDKTRKSCFPKWMPMKAKSTCSTER